MGKIIIYGLVLAVGFSMACGSAPDDPTSSVEEAIEGGTDGDAPEYCSWAVHPVEPCVKESDHELCFDHVDNNCNGSVDEGCNVACKMESYKELCWDGVDNNCNGCVDEGCPVHLGPHLDAYVEAP